MRDYLTNVAYDKALQLVTGVYVHNLYELAEHIALMDKQDFLSHLKKQDIERWITRVVGDKYLARNLEKISNQTSYLETIEHRIKKLEHTVGYPQRRFSLLPGLLVLFLVALIVEGVFIAYLLNTLTTREDYGPAIIDEYNARLTQLKQENLRLAKQQETLSNNLMTCEQDRSTSCSVSTGPSDTLAERNIIVNNQRTVITYPGIVLARLTPTGSMLPTFGAGANLLQVRVDPQDLAKGDIIAFTHRDALIVHRIVAIDVDDEGWYAVTKGDNLKLTEKIRADQVAYKVVGILY